MDSMTSDLTQYVILRDDLRTSSGPWPRGALIAQACHACIAVNSEFRDNPDVSLYTSLSNLPHLRTVVLSVPSESSLLEYYTLLTSSSVNCHLFTEQPESIPTCLATIPLRKSRLGSLLSNLRTFR